MTKAVETRMDGDPLVVRIPIRFQRRGNRKRIVAPDGGELTPSTKPQPHGTLVKPLARAWLEEGREVRALAELRDLELERAEAGVEAAWAMAIPVVEPLGRALVAARADHAVYVGLHQELQHRLGDTTQEVAVVGLLEQLD